MKIAVLIENTKYQPEYNAEHGLSLYIETDKHNILFDFGQSDAYLENANKLGIDLKQVDVAVLSHGHYDHGGGLKRFLELNTQAIVYVNKNAFMEHYNGTDKYIGINQELKNHPRLKVLEDDYVIDEQLELITCNTKEAFIPIDSAGLNVKVNDCYKPDTFQHEQYLMIHENNRNILISGCSHKGIINLVHWLHPDVLIGGFHYKKEIITEEKNQVLDHAVHNLSLYHTIYYTGHCTGVEQYKYMKNKMNDKLFYLSAGQVLEL